MMGWSVYFNTLRDNYFILWVVSLGSPQFTSFRSEFSDLWPRKDHSLYQTTLTIPSTSTGELKFLVFWPSYPWLSGSVLVSEGFGLESDSQCKQISFSCTGEKYDYVLYLCKCVCYLFVCTGVFVLVFFTLYHFVMVEKFVCRGGLKKKHF